MTANGPKQIFDTIVIGGGVVGCAIIRELAKYDLSVALLEKESDVGDGTSKGNSAIMHTGFDAKPGSLEARMVADGSVEFRNEVAPALNIPCEPIGALVIAYNSDQEDQLDQVLAKAAKNGIDEVKLLTPDEIYALEPHLASGIRGGVSVANESIVDPFAPPIAYASQAYINGAKIILSSEVTGIRDIAGEYHEVITNSGSYYGRYVINAAGLWGDRVDGFLDIEDFHITPRRGEFIIFDTAAKRLVNHIILQVPTPKTKGILISPTIFGNVILGPTADDIEDRTTPGITRDGIEKIRNLGAKVMPDLLLEDITSTYAGNRAATEFSDYQIKFYGGRRYVTVGGIRSTGLSGALAIAHYVVDGIAELGMSLQEKANFKDYKRLNNLSEYSPRPYQQLERIQKNPKYGQMVCFCELVSEQEILDAMQEPLSATSLKSLRKRTRATMGRCQGFNCAPKVYSLLSEHSGHDIRLLVS